MATRLEKPVTRQTMSTDRKGRALLVTLEPGDMLTFRAKGKRTRYSIYIGHCYSLAQLMTAETDYSDKLKAYKAKKDAGQRAVRPKKPSMPFSKIYFDALK